MIPNAVDAIKATATALDYRPDITVKMFTGLVRNGHLTTIRVDDNMIHGTDCTHNKSIKGMNCKGNEKTFCPKYPLG